MIIELFIIYVLVVFATKNREEIKELKEQIKAAGLDTLFPQKGK